MGYVRLRALLHKRRVFMSQVSKECGIDYNRLYHATATSSDTPADLTPEEKQDIYRRYFSDNIYAFEEVFEQNENIQVSNYTISSYNAQLRRKAKEHR